MADAHTPDWLYISSPFPAPADYGTLSTSVVTFNPGTTRQPVMIPIVDDGADEDVENFFARLTVVSAPDDDVVLQPDETGIVINDNDGKWEGTQFFTEIVQLLCVVMVNPYPFQHLPSQALSQSRLIAMSDHLTCHNYDCPDLEGSTQSKTRWIA